VATRRTMLLVLLKDTLNTTSSFGTRPPPPSAASPLRHLQRPVVAQHRAHVPHLARAHAQVHRPRALVDRLDALQVAVALALRVAIVDARFRGGDLAPRVGVGGVEGDGVAGGGHDRAAAPAEEAANVCVAGARLRGGDGGGGEAKEGGGGHQEGGGRHGAEAGHRGGRGRAVKRASWRGWELWGWGDEEREGCVEG